MFFKNPYNSKIRKFLTIKKREIVFEIFPKNIKTIGPAVLLPIFQRADTRDMTTQGRFSLSRNLNLSLSTDGCDILPDTTMSYQRILYCIIVSQAHAPD